MIGGKAEAPGAVRDGTPSDRGLDGAGQVRELFLELTQREIRRVRMPPDVVRRAGRRLPGVVVRPDLTVPARLQPGPGDARTTV